jgi:RNA polymerase sigma-70 factor (ECF subfamily)
MAGEERTEAFLQLFVRAEPRVYAFIRTMVFNRTDAEDLFQDTAAVLWREFDKFEPGTNFDRWAMAVALNQVRSLRQKHHRNILAFSEPLFAAITASAEHLGERTDEFLTDLQRCMEKLAETDRDLVRRRYQPNVTTSSLARELGRSVSTVSRSLNRIQQILLRCIRRTISEEEMKCR